MAGQRLVESGDRGRRRSEGADRRAIIGNPLARQARQQIQRPRLHHVRG
jgi:hypothetical protein